MKVGRLVGAKGLKKRLIGIKNTAILKKSKRMPKGFTMVLEEESSSTNKLEMATKVTTLQDDAGSKKLVVTPEVPKEELKMEMVKAHPKADKGKSPVVETKLEPRVSSPAKERFNVPKSHLENKQYSDITSTNL
ncbi:hypothetical protein R1flu_019989 [Riccia fluitans]|uniref:Uncharacterized protein n=1 Tax=Riccia fluitans TaxID=41844 RepID=A0ABD1ZME6_9MARC